MAEVAYGALVISKGFRGASWVRNIPFTTRKLFINPVLISRLGSGGDVSPDSGMCSGIQESKRLDCYPESGASEQGCYSRECFWCETNTPNIPWCFYNTTDPSEIPDGGGNTGNSGSCPTTIPENSRIDCWPGSGATSSGCVVSTLLVCDWFEKLFYMNGSIICIPCRIQDAYGVQVIQKAFRGAFSILRTCLLALKTVRGSIAYLRAGSIQLHAAKEDVNLHP